MKSLALRAVRWLASTRLGRRLLDDSRDPVALVVALTLALVTVPALVAIFPEWITVPIGWQATVAGVWVLVALFTGFRAAQRDSALSLLASGFRRDREARLERVVLDVLPALLGRGAAGAPKSFAWSVYLQDGDRLRPFFPDEVVGEDPRVFTIGTGATGICFERNRPVTALGDKVSSGDYGLSKEQQAHFAASRAVVAVPLLDSFREPFGTLSAISSDEDDYFESRSAIAQVERLASDVEVLLALTLQRPGAR